VWGYNFGLGLDWNKGLKFCYYLLRRYNGQIKRSCNLLDFLIALLENVDLQL